MLPTIFRDEITIDGIRMYVKDDETLVMADTWDKLFKSPPKGEMNLKTKGDNPCKKLLFINDKKSY
jgi:hypothetical protein